MDPLLSQASRHADIREGGGIAPCILTRH